MAKPLALHILQDSGTPEGSSNYTTLVLLHGYGYHSGIFTKLLPLAQKHNARVVLVNRRDYPDTIPYTEDDLAVLRECDTGSLSSTPPYVRDRLVTYMKERGREVYDVLVRFVAENDIPPASLADNAGGIVIAGWSFGTAWMTALLANVSTFPVNDVELGAYVRRVIFHDAPYHTLGYSIPTDYYNPLFDTSLPPEQVVPTFTAWVSGFFDHGDLFGAPRLELRTPLADPPPTLTTFTDEERENSVCRPPSDRGGSDAILIVAGNTSGAFAALREAALYLPQEAGGVEGEDEDENLGVTDAWPVVEVRYVWGDRSIWEVVHGVASLRDEMATVREQNHGLDGEDVRDVTYVRLRGSNHFGHWNEPDRTMEAFLAPAATVAEQPV